MMLGSAPSPLPQVTASATTVPLCFASASSFSSAQCDDRTPLGYAPEVCRCAPFHWVFHSRTSGAVILSSHASNSAEPLPVAAASTSVADALAVAVESVSALFLQALAATNGIKTKTKRAQWNICLPWLT